MYQLVNYRYAQFWICGCVNNYVYVYFIDTKTRLNMLFVVTYLHLGQLFSHQVRAYHLHIFYFLRAFVSLSKYLRNLEIFQIVLLSHRFYLGQSHVRMYILCVVASLLLSTNLLYRIQLQSFHILLFKSSFISVYIMLYLNLKS